MQLECNGIVLFAFENGARKVTTFSVAENLAEITGLEAYYVGPGRVRLDTDDS